MPRGQPALNAPTVVIALIAVFVAVHLWRTQWAGPEADGIFLARAAFIPVRLVAGFFPENWPVFTSPVTYAFIHGSWTHLAVNALWLLAFGSPLAGRIGTLRFLAFFVVTAVCAALFHAALHPESFAPLVGASGAVSGMTAAAARFGLSARRGAGDSSFSGAPMGVIRTLMHPPALIFIAVWFAINMLGAFTPAPGGGSIAWEAHIGGFLAGLFLLGAFVRGRG